MMMLYFEDKVQLMVRYAHIKNRIKRLSNFNGEKYEKYEEIAFTEIKEIFKLVEEDMMKCFEEQKDFTKIMNMGLEKDCNNFSLLIESNDCMENDFFLNFLVYINLFEMIKCKEYHGLELLDIQLDYLNNLLNSFEVCAKEGKLVFKFENVAGSYYSLSNTVAENKLEPYICFESIENNDGCFNTYYVNNVNDYVLSKFNELFNIKY